MRESILVVVCIDCNFRIYVTNPKKKMNWENEKCSVKKKDETHELELNVQFNFYFCTNVFFVMQNVWI